MSSLILPPRLEKHNLYREFSAFLDANDTLPTSLDIDFSRLTFTRPPNVVFLSIFASWLTDAGVDVTFSGMNCRKEVIRYLDDSSFFKNHLGKRLNPSSSCRNTTIPLLQIDKSECHGWIEFTFLPWLSNNAALPIESLYEVAVGLKELFNNISDHTNYEVGCIFGQWYPKEKKIILSIADIGQGIPSNVEKVVSGLSHNEAIVRAAEDGFSSQSIPSNRGAGLFYLLSNIVKRFNGKIAIRSLTGYVEFENVTGDIKYTKYKDVGFCVGTTIDLVIYTDKIPIDDIDEIEEVMEW